MERVNEKLRSSIDSAILDYNKLMGDNHRLLSDKFEQNNKDIKSFIEKKQEEGRVKILEERRKLDAIVEGRC